MTREPISWNPLPGLPDKVSACGRLYARYRYTSVSGYPFYHIHSTAIAPGKRTLRNAHTVGGLPTFVVAATI